MLRDIHSFFQEGLALAQKKDRWNARFAPRDIVLDDDSASGRYYAAKAQRTPKWADLAAIAKFYDECPGGYVVDHVIPLRGHRVSGLHVLENLQYIPRLDNIAKSNRWP